MSGPPTVGFLNVAFNAGSRSAGGPVCSNGMRRMRRQIARSLWRIRGASFAASQSLNCGMKSKYSPNRKRGDRVAAGQLLDDALGKALAVGHFDGHDEAGTRKGRNVVRDASVALLLEERLEVSGARIVTERGLDGLRERRLARRLGAVEEEKDL